MKILWYSTTPWVQTGYGQQTYQFVKALQHDGHKVKIVPMNGQLVGSPNITWDGIDILATGNDKYSVDALLYHTQTWKPDLVISLFDVWVLPEDFGVQVKLAGGKWCPIVPIDHSPISKVLADRLAFAHMPIAMSKFGLREMQDAELDRARYIPHAFDGTIFKPRNIRMWSNDKFHVGIVAANLGSYDRKAWQENLEAYASFHRHYPDTLLYVHSDPEARGSLDLLAMAKALNIRMVYPFQWQLYQGMNRETMCSIYNSMDVLLASTRGEGFGVPIIEAQACGVPAIVTDFSAMKELSPYRVEPNHKVWIPLNSWQVVPKISDIEGWLSWFYRSKAADGSKWTDIKRSVKKDVQKYSLPSVMSDHFYPVIEEAKNWPLTSL